MKRSWLTILSVAGAIALLTLFLGLQYNWLVEASEAERERMQKRVETDTNNFAADFNREVQSAYFNFQADAGKLKAADYSEFAERYDFWKERTEYPELIRRIVFLSAESNAKPLVFNAETKAFTPTETDAAFTATIDKLRSPSERPPVLVEPEFALVVPVHAMMKRVNMVIRRDDGPPVRRSDMPPPEGYVVVFLDESVIRDRMLPALYAKHFPEKDYQIVVKNEAGDTVFGTGEAAVYHADAKAPLFELRPDNLIFFANREVMLPRGEPGTNAGAVFNQRIESRTVEGEKMEHKITGETFKIELHEEGGKPRVAGITHSSGPGEELWSLSARHASGSIDAFVRSERTRSFLIGLGIYLLLVGSIVAIAVSAMRWRLFAQRQIDFVSSVSHEFRTPLAVIYSAGENLADGVAKDENQISKYGNLIKGEGKKLSGMVEQVLEFAGARSGKRKYSFAETDVAAVATSVLNESTPLLKDKGFEIQTDIAPGLPPVNADADALSRAVSNLIQNSIKYSNGSRWLRVSAENGNGTVKISVEDRGIGITPADQKKIFEPFYRTKDVVDAQIHGNGLGLSLVREIATAHGGSVNVTSEPGKGSKFTIELPQM